MLRLKHKIAVRLIATLCVAMQIAVVLPHHHHDESAAACINILHCVEMAHEQTECTDSKHNCDSHDSDNIADKHKHHSTADDCHLNRVELVSPARDDSKDLFATSLGLDTPLFTLFDITSDVNLHNYSSQSSVDLPEIDIELPSQYVLYIVAASPTRAPAFTV